LLLTKPTFACSFASGEWIFILWRINRKCRQKYSTKHAFHSRMEMPHLCSDTLSKSCLDRKRSLLILHQFEFSVENQIMIYLRTRSMFRYWIRKSFCWNIIMHGGKSSQRINELRCLFRIRLFVWWWLTPLSTIFQLCMPNK
jgi:hypothetical protein